MSPRLGILPALIVVDLQEYFLDPASPMGRAVTSVDAVGAALFYERMETTVVPNVRRLLAAWRAAELPVVFTEFGSAVGDGSDLPPWAKRHNAFFRPFARTNVYGALDDPSSRTVAGVAPERGERVVRKTTSGPVNSTALDQEGIAAGSVDISYARRARAGRMFRCPRSSLRSSSGMSCGWPGGAT